MKPKKINVLYVSGKITGEKRWRKKFETAYWELRAVGYLVYMPTNSPKRFKTWEEAMRWAISYMLEKAQGVALLPDWEQSKGARIERQLALDLGMPVKTVDQWVEERRKK